MHAKSPLDARQEGAENTDVRVWVNAPIDGLRRLLGSGLVGLHTMADEHFGIGIVEYMAAGYALCSRVLLVLLFP
jgi:alpha-1,2-mannosyltransferase